MNPLLLLKLIGHFNALSLDLLPQCITSMLEESYTGKLWNRLGWPNKSFLFINLSHSKPHILSTV